MKKNLLLLLAVLATGTLSFGKTVPLSTAKTVGYNYLHQHGAAVNSANDLNLVYTSGTGTTPYFYVLSSNHSFVLVTADDGVIPVLGYSNEGAFVATNISRNITGFFEDYNKQIDYVINNNTPATTEIATQWDNLVNNKTIHSAARTTDVSPMLTTTWDQAPYYNDDCPSDGSGQAVTGCVATATAQVMKFWSWPATGVGSHSYTTSSYGTLSANFAASTYNWSSMPNSISGSNAAIARLMSDVGISVEMDYSATESGSYAISSATGTPPYCAEYSLKNFFNYAPTLHGEQRMDYTDVTWISMLQTDLTAGHPIIYTGQGTAGGHCFVFDGYQSSGSTFHVNWGWSGMDNGYFTIDALNPASLGTGGGAGGFNSDQQAIFGIKPAGTAPVSTGMSLAGAVTLSASPIGYTQAFNVTAVVHNGGSTAFSGFYTAFIFDTHSTLIDSVQVISGSLAAGATSGVLTFSTTGLVPLLAGNYTVSIYARSSTSGWTLVSDGIYINSAPLEVDNSAPLEVYAPITVTTPSTGVLVQGQPATVTANFLNNDNVSFADFSGYIEMVLLDMTGSVVALIQNLNETSVALPYSDIYSPGLTFSTTSITATPGTYLLTAGYSTDGTNYYYAGADFNPNPVYVTVVAPPLSPDIYEVNNTAATAYNLTSTLTWASNLASTGTPGANFHTTSDQDYYKLVLPAGYHYTIKARVNDEVSSDDAVAYTADAVWSYSTNGGSTWSTVYDDVMTGAADSISLPGTSGGTVIFHVSSHYGPTGTYLLKISTVKRYGGVSVPELSLDAVKIFPNPATDELTVDLSATEIKGINATLWDMQGRKVYDAGISNQAVITIPVNTLAAGMYMMQVNTDAGVINKKITVSAK